MELADDTDSAAASASISEILGSRRPFSSSDSTEGARPTRSPSSASVSPRERRDVAQPLAEHVEVKARNWQGSRFLLSESLHIFTINEDRANLIH